jgi:CRP/FNR family transcriptional regulator, cyclic AMP receptor protein
MSSQGTDAPLGGSSRWTARPGSARQLSSPSLYGYLLDLDDDLAEVLEVRMRYSARQHVTARLLDADLGACELASWFAVVGDGPGLLMIDGLLAVDTRVADRTTTELLGSGDLLQPPGRHDDEMVDRETVWRALSPSRLALLDAAFAERVRSWPAILNALFRRAERRADDLDVMRAISCQPRLEVRLVLLLWHLAARWGRVEPGGLRLKLPLTHRLLGQLVAAERPSVSHALHRLSEAGIVTGTAGDWHLHGSVESHLEALLERTVRLTPQDQAGHTPRRALAPLGSARSPGRVSG